MRALGRHVMIEMWGVEPVGAEVLERALRDAVAAIDGTLLDVRVVPFPVHGVTGVAIMAESHVAVHTWPEHRYAAADIFTCNSEADLQRGIDALSRHLKPERCQLMEVRRGTMP